MKTTEVKIKYDSIKIKTDIYIDQEKMENIDLTRKIKDKKLNEWKKYLPEILAEYINRKSFTLHFEGKDTDKENLFTAVKEFNIKQSKYKILFNTPILSLSYNPYIVEAKFF